MGLNAQYARHLELSELRLKLIDEMLEALETAQFERTYAEHFPHEVEQSRDHLRDRERWVSHHVHEAVFSLCREWNDMMRIVIDHKLRGIEIGDIQTRALLYNHIQSYTGSLEMTIPLLWESDEE